MSKSKFKEAFRRGRGIAYLELKNSDHIDDYKDIVLWCCLHNTCYDMQCEGGRGIYLYNAITLFEDKSFFEEAIIKHFENKISNTWLFDQLCDLVLRFALDGSKKARNTLYKKYDTLFTLLSRKHKIESISTDRDGFESLCVCLTSLGGFRAFKRIIEQIGEFYLKSKNLDLFIMDWFYSNAQNKFGKKRVDDYMCMNAKKSKATAAFLKQLESYGSERPQTITLPSLNELVKACYELPKFHARGAALRFSRNASLEELIELANIAVKETNPKIKVELLWAFRKRPFPLDDSYIFELAESDNKDIRDIAYEMMAYLSSDFIHDYAISLIAKKKELANALSLLCHCYRPEDEILLSENLKRLAVSYNNGLWHGVYMDAEDLLRTSSCSMKPGIFLYMYKHTLCSSCRSSLVQIMYKRKILPLAVLEECLYDSYDDTRKFASRKLKFQP